MFQSGVQIIPNGASIATVTFPVAFTSTPDVILPAVRNTSADGSKWIVSASVVEQDSSEFTVSFDVATNTGNYELVWIAGGVTAVLDAMTALMGRKITTHGAMPTLQQGFKFPVLQTSPTTIMKLVDQETFWASVPMRSPDVPAAATAGGRDAPLILTADENWLYVGRPAGWARLPLDSSPSWATQPFYVPFREAVANITAVGGQIAYVITFATAFASGNIPRVMVTPMDVSASDPKTILGWQITNVTLAGFTITFSSPPETNNLQVYYMARQLP